MSEKVANELMIKLAKRRSWEQTETPEKSIQELRESMDADNLTMSNSKDSTSNAISASTSSTNNGSNNGSNSGNNNGNNVARSNSNHLHDNTTTTTNTTANNGTRNEDNGSSIEEKLKPLKLTYSPSAKADSPLASLRSPSILDRRSSFPDIIHSSNSNKEICIIGAGLAGAMLAALLAKLGFHISIYEKRPDPRLDHEAKENINEAFGASTSAIKRSINLALSHRGMEALKEVGLLDKIMSKAIKMPCRVIHNLNGTVNKQPYGKSENDAIWSVCRQSLNIELLNLLTKPEFNNRVSFYFDHSLVNTDKTGMSIFKRSDGTLTNAKQYGLVVGADGAYSSVRECMLKSGRINFNRTYIAHGYKELNMPPNASGDYALADHNGLHIWPRDEFMMIALPNPDKSFTMTLFAPYNGVNGYGFDKVNIDDSDCDKRILDVFQKYFPDIIPLMPDIINDYKRNPVGSLVTIKVDPWNYGKILLIGDAAHAVVPFYGQGMNAAFEDGLILYEYIRDAMKSAGVDANTDNISEKINVSNIIREFAAHRTPSANSLADLCVEHYHDMAANVASNMYLFKKRVENAVSSIFPSLFTPLYTMIAFTRIPYNEANDIAVKQEKLLDSIVTFVSRATKLSLLLAAVYGYLKYTKKIN
jgi:kynurenine 3-monooxygenase